MSHNEVKGMFCLPIPLVVPEASIAPGNVFAEVWQWPQALHWFGAIVGIHYHLHLRHDTIGDKTYSEIVSQGTPTLCITAHRSYKILGNHFLLLRCARRWTSKPLRSRVANRCDDHLLDVAPALDDSCCVKRTNMPRASGLGPKSETSNCSFGDIPRQ